MSIIASITALPRVMSTAPPLPPMPRSATPLTETAATSSGPLLVTVAVAVLIAVLGGVLALTAVPVLSIEVEGGRITIPFIDAEAGTPVYAPLPGTVHAFARNEAPGDYGPVLLLRHETNNMGYICAAQCIQILI
mgnify:CR=1 FL=1